MSQASNVSNELKATVLIVDDNSDNLDVLSGVLRPFYKVKAAINGELALKVAGAKNKPDIILLDIMMPEMDGIEACEKIRAIKSLENTLIAFLTARNEDYSQVAGFEAGADDYITKPIKPKVLVSKVKSLLRRLKAENQADSNVVVGDITINRDEYVVLKGDKKIFLPRKEFELFSLLTSKPGKVFKRETILDRVWGNEVVVGGRTIDVHIRKLREKIGDNYFKTVKGVGYKFVLEGIEK